MCTYSGKSGKQRSWRGSRTTASDLPLDHFPSTYQGEREKNCFPRPRAIHFRAKLSRGGVAIKRSVSPSRIVVPESSLPSSQPPPLPHPLLFPTPSSSPADDLHSPSPFNSLLPLLPRTTTTRAPSPPCRIQMSLFSGPLRSPFTQPCAVTRRGRGREKDYAGWRGTGRGGSGVR